MNKKDSIEWWTIITSFILGMCFMSFIYWRVSETIGLMIASLLSFLILSTMERKQ